MIIHMNQNTPYELILLFTGPIYCAESIDNNAILVIK